MEKSGYGRNFLPSDKRLKGSISRRKLRKILIDYYHTNRSEEGDFVYVIEELLQIFKLPKFSRCDELNII